MSNMIVFNLESLGVPHASKCPPERLVEVDPSYKSWEQDNVNDGSIRCGIWEATPGSHRSVRGESWEHCTPLSGVMDLIEDGKEPRRLKAGDTFVMRPGFVGTWRSIKTVRKLWVIVSSPEAG
ncbi:putative cupin superfamily protein [Rhizobium aquaticum]|uniref:Cupin superfamily protein n=1 Tax=Rhizobium aquaticum TaxID=1549636 RepID=A0ABV2J8R3_9HYPH